MLAPHLLTPYALSNPLALASGLRFGSLEFWLVSALAVIASIKVIGLAVRKVQERANASRDPLIVVPPSRNRPPALQVPPMPIEPLPMAQPIMQPQHAMEPPTQVAPRLDVADETSETIRIDTGGDGRIQFLPGRLEVMRGAQPGREFHFLRVPGQSSLEVTVGRAYGAAHKHIQIPEPTVSRLHARLSYEDRTWRIANLSVTNPVRINGQELASPEEAVTLSDGDRIQLGDVELCYRDGRP